MSIRLLLLIFLQNYSFRLPRRLFMRWMWQQCCCFSWFYLPIYSVWRPRALVVRRLSKSTDLIWFDFFLSLILDYIIPAQSASTLYYYRRTNQFKNSKIFHRLPLFSSIHMEYRRHFCVLVSSYLFSLFYPFRPLYPRISVSLLQCSCIDRIDRHCFD